MVEFKFRFGILSGKLFLRLIKKIKIIELGINKFVGQVYFHLCPVLSATRIFTILRSATSFMKIVYMYLNNFN